MKVVAETDRIINKLCFKDGDIVKQGDEILQTEMMKMISPVVAPISGKIKYKVAEFDYVYAGMTMAEIDD